MMTTRIEVWRILFWCLYLIVAIEAKSCVPIAECSPIYDLIRQIQSNQIPRYSTRPELIQRIRRLKCGTDPTNWESPQVWCQVTVSQQESFITRGALDTLGRALEDCEGSLRLSVIDPVRGALIFEMDAQRVNILSRWSNDLTPKFVTRFQVIGNCCWQLFEKSWQRGQSQILIPGFVGSPLFVPHSLRVTECPEE
ncbi:hypothetical protein TCAL_14250 [Tigriopus californicus]|uniref:Clip domain-containing protein n=1 Tax=Tigriopus californicus TaxID=6832 RepID=A0A553NTT7_TIGCA|nr:hypothetical protein TCAL_14250 [Tigriopus californicus]